MSTWSLVISESSCAMLVDLSKESLSTATAMAIAKEIGIIPKEDNKRYRHTVMTASEFDGFTDAEIDQFERLPNVIGRCRSVNRSSRATLFLKRDEYIAPPRKLG